MQLKETTMAALDVWVKPPTWYRGGYDDMRRFYRFVSQYQRDHGCVIVPDLAETIIKAAEANGHPIEKEQTKAIDNFIALAYKILDFLEETGR